MITTTATPGQKLQVWGYPGMEVDLGGIRTFSDEEFLNFCRRNPDARIERESNGEITIMAPTHTETGATNMDLLFLVTVWARKNRTGRVYDSSTGFTLANGALRSPDVSWVSHARWNALSDGERSGFAHICPDFIIELRSESDTLRKLHSKMQEYIENGASLGWLIDPIERKIYVYRPETEIEILEDPNEVTGNPLLTGFTLNLTEIWG